jgi:hypothetical protein
MYIEKLNNTKGEKRKIVIYAKKIVGGREQTEKKKLFLNLLLKILRGENFEH